MNTNEAAALAATTPRKIRELIQQDEIIAYKVNGRWDVSETCLRLYLGLPVELEAPAAEAPAPAPASAPVDTEAAIRTAYMQLAGEHGNWVDLADLRGKVAAPAEKVTATLLEMMLRFSDTQLVPEADQKTLTEARRAAAVHLHGAAKHLLVIEAV